MAAQQGNWSQADKGAWQRERLKLEMARGLYAPAGPVARFLAATEPPAPKERITKRGKRLVFAGKSTCFDELSWRNGIVHAVFWNGYTYDAELDEQTFRDWTVDSAGHFYNEILGQGFFSSK
jgi:hypothetical protein